MFQKKIFILITFLISFNSSFSQWQVINSGVTSNLVDGCFTNDSTGFIISENGNVLKTINNGNTWSTTTTLSGFFTSICHVGSDTIFAGGNCIYKSYNGGLTWNLVTTLTYTITDLVFFSAKNGFAVVPGYTTCIWSGGTVNSENYKVYKSTDFGLTWQQNHSECGHTSYFDLINDSTAIIPSGFVISGMHCNNGGGLDAFKTNNNGLSWYGIKQPFYGDPYISFVNDTIGYYIQSGNQYMFSTIDGGNSLSQFNINIITPVLKQCKFITQNQGYLVAQQDILKTNSRGINWSNDYTSTSPLNYLFKNKDSVLIGLGGNGLIIKKIASLHTPIDSIYQAQLSNNSIDFGIVNINSSSLNSFSIKNTGNSQTTFSITSSNDFKINFNTTSFVNSLNVTLNPSHDTLVYVQFNPLLVQNYKDTISVGFHGINRKIPVKGTGISALCGTIAQDTIICVDTLKICGDVTILPSAKMTICAGTYIQLLGNYRITVQGILKAIGNMNDSITFGIKNPNIPWKGIMVYSNIWGDSTVLSYCKITAPSSSSSILHNGGRLTIDHCKISNPQNSVLAIEHTLSNYTARLHLSNSEISNTNSDGIFIFYGDSTYIINNEIHDNRKGITFSANSGLIVKDNKIYNNSQVGIYGSGVADIINNDIHDNVGGILLTGQAKIENNKIYNNRAADFGGIKIILSSYGYLPSINQNLIFNNSAIDYGGAGIKIESSLSGGPTLTLSIVNNTICNNLIENNGVGHNVYAYASSPPLNVNFFNNIIYSSFDIINNFKIHSNVTAVLKNNCINQFGLNTLGQNNINNYPEFILPTSSSGILSVLGSYDWSLKQNSHCIDAGDLTDTTYLLSFDFIGNLRIFNNRVDIGAYEYQGFYNGIQDSTFSSIFYPNPFDKNINILLDNNSSAEVSIYDISSRLLLRQKFIKSTVLNTEALSEGVYIYEIKTSDGKSQKGKIIKL